MFGDMGKMMQQVKEMKANMKAAQKELQNTTLEGTSKNHDVTFTIDGEMDVKTVSIKQDALKSNVSELEKVVLEAIKDAISKAKKTAADKLGTLTGGLNLPGM